MCSWSILVGICHGKFSIFEWWVMQSHDTFCPEFYNCASAFCLLHFFTAVAHNHQNCYRENSWKKRKSDNPKGIWHTDTHTYTHKHTPSTFPYDASLQVLEHFFAKYDLDSPLRLYLMRSAERLAEERGAVERELVPTLALKAALDGQVFFFFFNLVLIVILIFLIRFVR